MPNDLLRLCSIDGAGRVRAVTVSPSPLITRSEELTADSTRVLPPVAAAKQQAPRPDDASKPREPAVYSLVAREIGSRPRDVKVALSASNSLPE